MREKSLASDNDMNYSKSVYKMQYLLRKKPLFFCIFCEKTSAFRVKRLETSFFLFKSLEISRNLKNRWERCFFSPKENIRKKRRRKARFPTDNTKKGKNRRKKRETGNSKGKGSHAPPSAPCAQEKALKDARRHTRRRGEDCQAQTKDARQRQAEKSYALQALGQKVQAQD